MTFDLKEVLETDEAAKVLIHGQDIEALIRRAEADVRMDR